MSIKTGNGKISAVCWSRTARADLQHVFTTVAEMRIEAGHAQIGNELPENHEEPPYVDIVRRMPFLAWGGLREKGRCIEATLQ